MSNIIPFPTKLGSQYFRITSACKPTESAISKLDHIISRGWKEFTGHDFVCYFSPYDGEPYYLDDAFGVECRKAMKS